MSDKSDKHKPNPPLVSVKASGTGMRKLRAGRGVQGASVCGRAMPESVGKRLSKVLCRLPRRLTQATLIDRNKSEIEITDFMTRRACDEMDALQQFPFAPGPRRA